MDERIQKVLDILHERFSNEENQYSEFENSDIEYFVSCMLYNHFDFIKALETMKTIDLSYDFLQNCGNEYDEVMAIINSIDIDDEAKKIEFLQDFIKESQSKYTSSELYLLNRMAYHVNGVAQRYIEDAKINRVEFRRPIV